MEPSKQLLNKELSRVAASTRLTNPPNAVSDQAHAAKLIAERAGFCCFLLCLKNIFVYYYYYVML